MSGLLETAVMAGALLAMMTWLVVVVLAPRRWSTALTPTRRAISARLWLYAPVWVPVALVAAAFGPALLSSFFGAPDHCLVHTLGDHHHHLCLRHPPHATGHIAVWILPALVLAPASRGIVSGWRRARRELSLVRALVGVSRPSDLGDDIRMLEQPEPIAVTVGWLRPKVLISTGLRDRVSGGTLQAIVAHERAHIDRRDTLFAAVDRLVAKLLPASVHKILLGQLALAQEQACDDVAAAGAGGRLQVAQALTEVARLGLAQPAAGLSIASGSLQARVMHLVEPPTHGRRWVLAPIVVLACLLAAGTGPIHDALEHLVAHLPH